MSHSEIKTGYEKLIVSDNTEMNAYTAMPSGMNSPLPGLIIFQEAFGVNKHIRNIAELYASKGFVTIAPELFHRSAPFGFEGSYSDFAAVAPHMMAITEPGLEADIRAAWDWLQANSKVKHDQISCIGYCMGGRTAFFANSLLPFKAAVSYYGGRIAPDLLKYASRLHAPMLFYWGGLDQHITSEQIDAVTKAMDMEHKTYTNVKFSYADHGFNCDHRASFHPKASKDALAMTLAFLEQEF
jgi:carboxymethylenebutenolidase